MPASRPQLPDLDAETFRRRCLDGLAPSAEIGARLDADTWNRLFSHYQLLRRWAPAVALIGRGATTEAPARHYGESLAGLEHLDSPRGGPCLDFGSGAGFPGLMLAACRPQREFVLVESRQRKAAFLRRAIREMRLERCTVVASRWGDRGLDEPPARAAVEALEPFRALTARAVDLEPWYDSIDDALAADAVWLAWGRGAEPRGEDSGWEQATSVRFAGERCLTVHRRRPSYTRP